ALLLSTSSFFALADNQAVEQTLSRLSLSNVEIKTAPLPGYKLILAKEGIFYLSDDGRYLIEGDIYDMNQVPAKNILTPLLTNKVNELASKDAIVYKAKAEKYVVTVFTDITCSYCQKLHQQIADYNAQGIT